LHAGDRAVATIGNVRGAYREFAGENLAFG